MAWRHRPRWLPRLARSPFAERMGDSRNGHLGACEAMRHRHDMPNLAALPDLAAALPTAAEQLASPAHDLTKRRFHSAKRHFNLLSIS
jgi:hypothetical protein